MFPTCIATSKVPDLGSKGWVSQFCKLELEITSRRLILGASSTPTFYQKQSEVELESIHASLVSLHVLCFVLFLFFSWNWKNHIELKNWEAYMLSCWTGEQRKQDILENKHYSTGYGNSSDTMFCSLQKFKLSWVGCPKPILIYRSIPLVEPMWGQAFVGDPKLQKWTIRVSC